MTTRPLVMIADDDASTRALLEAALNRDGFDTVVATNGRDVLALLREHPVQVLLLDDKMPFLDGLRTLRAIRGSDRFRTLPVIMVTGSDEEADRVRGLESGADDYLSKPVQMRELTARVRAQVRERAAWTSELDRGRANRRNLAAALEGLATSGSLLTIATEVVHRLPDVLDLDGAAILHFAGGTVRCIAASGSVASRFPPAAELPESVGADLATRAAAGPWLEAAGTGAAGSGSGTEASTDDIAYVPFRLGPTAVPLGCLAYAKRPGSPAGPLSHRLRDLIDATDFIVVLLRPAIEQAETDDAAINRIRQVIEQRAFSTYLQPIVNLDDGATVAVEALTRFADGTTPDAGFAEAAAYGLGAALQRAAVAAAIEAVAGMPAGVGLSVNLSADVLQHEATLAAVMEGIDRPVIVELTEDERIDDYDAVRSAFEALGSNVRLAIDDAGSGYASLRHIFALQPAFVKLDIEWVRGIDADPVRRALVSGLVYFAKETGCELIAEGIETEAELMAVRGLGVKLGQGYLLGHPEAVGGAPSAGDPASAAPDPYEVLQQDPAPQH